MKKKEKLKKWKIDFLNNKKTEKKRKGTPHSYPQLRGLRFVAYGRRSMLPTRINSSLTLPQRANDSLCTLHTSRHATALILQSDIRCFFSRGRDPITQAHRARCQALVRPIFIECCPFSFVGASQPANTLGGNRTAMFHVIAMPRASCPCADRERLGAPLSHFLILTHLRLCFLPRIR